MPETLRVCGSITFMLILFTEWLLFGQLSLPPDVLRINHYTVKSRRHWEGDHIKRCDTIFLCLKSRDLRRGEAFDLSSNCYSARADTFYLPWVTECTQTSADSLISIFEKPFSTGTNPARRSATKFENSRFFATPSQRSRFFATPYG